MAELKYKRVLLKISGEALSNGNGGVEEEATKKIATVIKNAREAGAEIGIVIGGGNFWRGRSSGEMDRAKADYMGMLATIMNSIALQEMLLRLGVDTRLMTSMAMPQLAEPYNVENARRHLSEGRVVIIGGGLGAPFFSTDTAAALRAAEIEADALLMMKNIDYIYSEDPKKNPKAEKLFEITYSEILEKKMTVIDFTATSFCMDRKIPILMFGMSHPEKVQNALNGENIGTIVKE